MPRVRTKPTSEPPVPPQPLPEPAVPTGHRAIPLVKRIGGSNSKPQSLRFAVATYTVVDELDYGRFSQFRWYALWSENCRSYTPARTELIDGKKVTINLARELLGLPLNPGRGCDQQADHLNHDPLNNTRANLRVVTSAQNQANQRRRKDATHRFRGVRKNTKASGFHAQFSHNGSKLYSLPTVRVEVEAAFCYNHAVSLLRDQYAQRNHIPPLELPSPSRQLELISLVENKLRSMNLIA